MTGNDLLRAMNGIDEGFIESAKENPTKTQHIKRKRTICAAAGIAAAALLTIPAGAYAYTAFLHGANVEHYISGIELIEEQCPDAILNAVTENSDYRITVDSALSDGHNVMMVLTQEAKSPKGLLIKEGMGLVRETYMQYADGTPGPFLKTSYCDETPRTACADAYAFGSGTSVGIDKSVTVLSCRDVDPEKDVQIEFYYDLGGANAELYYWREAAPELLKQIVPDFDFNSKITNELDGMAFTMRFAPNVKCVPLTDTDGKTLYMSAFELYTEENDVLSTIQTSEYDAEIGGTCEQQVTLVRPETFFLLRNDGEKVSVDTDGHKSEICMRPDCSFFIYGMFIDPDEYMGVEINGRQYLKTGETVP